MSSKLMISAMPLEVYVEVAGHLIPAVLPEDFEPAMHMCLESERDIKALACVNRAFRSACDPIKLKLIHRIGEVRAKRLREFQSEYCSLSVDCGSSPMLLDACLSGLGLLSVDYRVSQKATYSEVTPKVIDDIKLMVELDPSLLLCRASRFRVHPFIMDVTPLLAAQLNVSIPPEITGIFLEVIKGEEETYRTFAGPSISYSDLVSQGISLEMSDDEGATRYENSEESS